MFLATLKRTGAVLLFGASPRRPVSVAHGDGEVDITEFDITECDVTFFQETDITESDVTKKGN